MVQTLQARHRQSPDVFSRLRVQLGGGLLFAVFLPYFVFVDGLDRLRSMGSIAPVGAGCLVALLLGIIFFRSIAPFPGVERSSNILSSFSMAYAIVVVVFLLWRFDYSRLLLLSSYLLALAWFYILYFLGERHRKLVIGVVPGGDLEQLLALERVNWVTLDDAAEHRDDLHAVAADLRQDIPDEWDRKITDYVLDGLPVFHSKHLIESLTGKVQLEHLSENSEGSLSPGYAWLRTKRVLDIIVSIIALVLLTPFLLIVGLMIRMDSPGPALFRQRRMGYRGEAFTVIKFRTMRAATKAADALDGAMTKEGDARITRLGAFLRRSRIDEIPQIINVIKGEMSIIGPRPEAEVLSQHYEEMIPFYRYRHIVYPGITGWAQVNQGHVTDVDDVREKLHFDFYYIKNFSPWLDLLIVAKTIRTMLTGFGSK